MLHLGEGEGDIANVANCDGVGGGHFGAGVARTVDEGEVESLRWEERSFSTAVGHFGLALWTGILVG